MCGIAGFLRLRGDGAAPPIEALLAMVGSLHHRGPDEAGVFRDAPAGIGLGHSRLSIVDLATGQQPMSDVDGLRWITFNGEIYNYRALRQELVDLGHRLRTHSDTEVILGAYAQWGVGAFERLRGQFALALWDAPSRTLVLARDRHGVRPLYTCEHAGTLWFGSEVKAIFAGDGSIPRSFDPVGLAETFTFWSPVAPQTVFRGVSELPPGHVRVISGGRSRTLQYWRPGFPETQEEQFRGTPEDAVRELRAAIAEAVRIRIEQADVPVGCYLSGGLDSAYIAALARAVKGDRLKTFSIRFAEPEFDETTFQRSVAEHVGSEHHEILVTRKDIAGVFPEVVRHAERPLLRTAPAPMYLLSGLARSAGLKVVLTGEGADEVFAGYDLFREARIRRFWGRVPDSRYRPMLLDRLYPYMARSPGAGGAMTRAWFGRDRARWAEPGFGHAPRWRSTSMLMTLFAPDLRRQMMDVDPVERLIAGLPEEFHRWSPLAQDQFLEMRTLLSGYLLSAQGDRMLMAHSVEGRFPYLDLSVVELARALPDRYKLRGLDEKWVLKAAARPFLPAQVVERPKQPYRAPDAVTFLGPDAPAWMDVVLDPSRLRDAGVLDPQVVERLAGRLSRTSATARPSNADDMALVGVVSTTLLYEHLIRAPASPHHPPPLAVHVDRRHDEAVHHPTSLEHPTHA